MIQNVLYIFCHDRVHLRDVLCQLGHIALRPCVHIQLLCLLYESICTTILQIQERCREWMLMISIQAEHGESALFDCAISDPCLCAVCLLFWPLTKLNERIWPSGLFNFPAVQAEKLPLQLF